MYTEVVKVLVSPGEDADQSVSLMRLSSYLSVSTEGSDQPPTIDPASALERTMAMSNPKPKDGELGFPDIPFRLEADEDDDYVLDASNPPPGPVVKPIEGNVFINIIRTYTNAACMYVYIYINSSYIHVHTFYRYT